MTPADTPVFEATPITAEDNDPNTRIVPISAEDGTPAGQMMLRGGGNEARAKNVADGAERVRAELDKAVAEQRDFVFMTPTGDSTTIVGAFDPIIGYQLAAILMAAIEPVLRSLVERANEDAPTDDEGGDE